MKENFTIFMSYGVSFFKQLNDLIFFQLVGFSAVGIGFWSLESYSIEKVKIQNSNVFYFLTFSFGICLWSF